MSNEGSTGFTKLSMRLSDSGSRMLASVTNKAFSINDEKSSDIRYLNLNEMEKQTESQTSITPPSVLIQTTSSESPSVMSGTHPSQNEPIEYTTKNNTPEPCRPASISSAPAGVVITKAALAHSLSANSNHSRNKTNNGGVELLHAFRGILLAFTSSVFFSLTAVIVKYVKDVDAGQMAVFRFAGMLLFSFPLALDAKSGLLGDRSHRHWLLLRGAAGATSLYLRYTALHYLPISNATVIVLSMPVFVCIFGRVFLKEACGIFHVIALATTLVGIAFTSKLDVIFGSSDEQARMNGVDRQGELYGLMSGMGAALVGSSCYILVRKIKHLPHSVILFNFSWVALSESVILTYGVHDGMQLPHDPVVPWLLVALGILSFYGQMLLTRALQADEAALVSVTRSSGEVFFAFIFQIAFFGQIPTLYSIIGAILVTTAVMLTSMRKWVITLPETHAARRFFWFTLK